MVLMLFADPPAMVEGGGGTLLIVHEAFNVANVAPFLSKLETLEFLYEGSNVLRRWLHVTMTDDELLDNTFFRNNVRTKPRTPTRRTLNSPAV